jgi:molybdopterin converting factor small subunit
MAQVWIPSLLRDLTGGKARIDAPGQTIGEVISALDASYPGIKARLCEGRELNPAIVAVVDGRTALLGLRERVGENSEIHFIPPVSGGTPAAVPGIEVKADARRKRRS